MIAHILANGVKLFNVVVKGQFAEVTLNSKSLFSAYALSSIQANDLFDNENFAVIQQGQLIVKNQMRGSVVLDGSIHSSVVIVNETDTDIDVELSNYNFPASMSPMTSGFGV